MDQRQPPQDAAVPDEFDVFLSHNGRDKPVVEEIGRWLTGQGLRVWLDKWELRPGFPWQEGLEEAVRASRAVAVFLGADSLGAWCASWSPQKVSNSRRVGRARQLAMNVKVPIDPVAITELPWARLPAGPALQSHPLTADPPSPPSRIRLPIRTVTPLCPGSPALLALALGGVLGTPAQLLWS